MREVPVVNVDGSVTSLESVEPVGRSGATAVFVETEVVLVVVVVGVEV
jgi:hypothetical protein